MRKGIDGSFPDESGSRLDNMTYWAVPAMAKVTDVAASTIGVPAFPVTLWILVSTLSACNETTTHHSIQCEEPRKDIFEYANGVASGVEHWSDDSMHYREYDLVGFDPMLLKAVFYTVTPADSLGLITIFEIDFANPAVTEHRIGPDVNVSFEFSGCRSINK